MGTSTSFSTATQNIDAPFINREAAFDGDGGKAISDYVASLPSGTTSVNVIVGTEFSKDDCLTRGGFLSLGCNYDAVDLLKDRVKLITPYFKKPGVTFTITPKFNDLVRVNATALVPVTTSTSAIANWTVTNQPVKQKLVNGKPSGGRVPNGRATSTTSATKPKEGTTWRR